MAPSARYIRYGVFAAVMMATGVISHGRSVKRLTLGATPANAC